MRALRDLGHRLIAIADDAGDDDDLRLRKRFGVLAGYISVVAPLSVVGAVPERALALPLGLSLSLISAVNLVVLARSHRLVRYVVVLLSAGVVFTVVAVVMLGGVAAAGAAMFWAFLAPAYGMLALGPRRATAWFLIFLGALAVVVALDPLVSATIPPLAYPIQLALYAFAVAGPATIVFLLFRYSDLRRREAQARSDELLYNAIPIPIAARLKHGEERIADAYPETTVLFADLVGFTPWAAHTEPEQVVGFLDGLFSRFDALAAANGVEKIKTIGDSYMAVAGAPEPRDDHAEAALAVARGMLTVLAEERSRLGLELDVRIGLASGPAVGGVIGQKRIFFDLWGDTVNLASRMETSGVPGRIQVAPSTWALIRDAHTFEERDAVDVKGVGRMTTYLLAESSRGATA
ncbi:MAG TPA: adenylate/guanylate cyclase domain-containing protein [Candidatus Limnocylindria bacterium]|nr:adenylate/guanylate cyclase domain-containing protein [Candidatus Limnocylindria bacterium]